jgi:hypothetical protein
MLKKMNLLFALMLALTLSGCGLNSQPLSTPEKADGVQATPSQSDGAITQEAAADILTEYLQAQGISKDTDPNLTILMDRTDEADGLKYYVFHAVDRMEDHDATIGWYGVQTDDGSLYDFSLMTPIDAAASTSLTFDINESSWNEEGVTINCPLLANSSDPDKADTINGLIMNDMRQVLETIRNNNPDDSLTIEGSLSYETPSSSVLSIRYDISYFTDNLAAPVNVFHSITISMDQAVIIPLSDLFVIDEAFVNAFKMGMYAPYRDDLNLEESVDSLYELVSGLYADADLINIFTAQNSAYYLTSQGIVLSVEVSHAMGDHLELAVNYESLEANIQKDHPFWNSYMYLAEPAG